MIGETPSYPDNPVGLESEGESGLTQQEKQQYIQTLQTMLNKGMDVSPHLGQGLKVSNGRIVERGFFDRSKKDLLRIGLLVAAGQIGGALTSGAAAPGAAGAEAAVDGSYIGADIAGTEAAALGGAGAAAGVGGAAAAVDGALPGTAGATGAGAGAAGAEAAVDGSYIGADVAGTEAQALGMGGGPLSILKTVGKYAQKAAPILGNMAKSGAEANQNRDRNAILAEGVKLARDKFALDAPTTRMHQTTKASMLNHAAPLTMQWGGPGSGLRGELPTYSGGATEALSHLSEDTGPLNNEVMRQNLQDQLSGRDHNMDYMKDMGKTSLLDKLIGIAASGTSLYGAVKG